METLKEKPILFSREMVRAILEGRKTQTRRVVKPQPVYFAHDGTLASADVHCHPFYKKQRGIKQYCEVGDWLWVKETFNADWCDEVLYRASCGSAIEAGYKNEPKWKPSIHMKRCYSRIDLEVENIHVEKLQDISIDDARAEGITEYLHEFAGVANSEQQEDEWRNHTTIENFKTLWNSINGEPRADGVDISWKANPWVWVVTFKLGEK